MNDFDSACLGNYGGGEDIVYKLVATPTTCVNIMVTGNTPSNDWFGVGVDDMCPLGTTCMGVANSGSGTVATISSVILPTGTYYVMVDTWPAPTCLSDFTLDIVTSTNCALSACCLSSECDVLTPALCSSAGGVYGGNGSTCSGLDCNSNGRDDSCDIVLGASSDCDGNGVPDECEAPLPIAAFAAVLVGADTDPVRQCMADASRDGVSDGEDVQPYVNRLLGV